MADQNTKQKDPLIQLEEMIREVHDMLGSRTQPVLRRYPLLFAFLLTFSVAAILHGFELFTDEFAVFHEYPSLLLWLGIVALLITGSLYKMLGKDHE